MSAGEMSIRTSDDQASDWPNESVPSTVASDPPTTASEPERSSPVALSADAGHGPDALSRAGQAQFLAELVAHRQAETPFALGLFGPAGAGKSHFLNSLLAKLETLSGLAASRGVATPFVSDIVVARIDASEAGQDPATAIAAAVFEAVAQRYPRLAAEARHAGSDPVKAAREIGEHVNATRRRLDAERQTLDGLKTRETRLADSVLFEASGSRVDAYARGNRSRIERVLRSFGFTRADPIATYKDLVRETAETGGPLGRIGIALRALWAYQGQGRLIIYALILFVIAWGAGILQGDQQDWLETIRGMGDKAAPIADWAQRNAHWLKPLSTAATVLGLVALAWNVVRAIRFLQPIFRGASLLAIDLEGRRRDLNGLLAHQTRLVDTLAAEVETSANHADEAERRASAHLTEGRTAGLGGGNPFGRDGGRDPARLFLAGLAKAMTEGKQAPGRVVLALDGFDYSRPDATAALIRTASTLSGPGFVTILAAERTQLATGFGETDPALAAAEINRVVQLGYELDSSAAAGRAQSDYARKLLQGTPAEAAPEVDAAQSALDRPWRPREAETVAALAPFAGDNPRATKTFVNLYRVVRADPRLRGAEPPVFTALALALALAAHGYPEDLTALEAVSKGEQPQEPGVLGEALAAARQASGAPVELAQARQALEVARSYTARM